MSEFLDRLNASRGIGVEKKVPLHPTTPQAKVDEANRNARIELARIAAEADAKRKAEKAAAQTPTDTTDTTIE